MTRFARAKGSKSSNEKVPEDGTPWELMKEQLLKAKKQKEEAKKREEAEKQRIENYENFLKEQKVQKRKATWCDFPEPEQIKKKKNDIVIVTNQSPNGKKKNFETTKLNQILDSTVDEAQEFKKNKKKKRENFISKTDGILEDDVKANTGNEVENINQLIKKKKKSKSNDIVSEGDSTLETNNCMGNTNGAVKKKNRRKKKKSITNETNRIVESNPKPEPDDHVENPNGEAKKKDKKKKKQSKLHEIHSVQDESFKSNTVNKKDNLSHKNILKKKKKMIDGKPVRRKAIDDRSFQLIINGKNIELVRFDGFPIMKKDAERLEELKKNMIKKRIPKSEVMRTIKLERRRAEKALARLKREVCYNCRKGGHNLSDCPDLKTKIPGVDEAAEGICFKCGSTEHRQFECKVQRDKEFRFATCFICKEQGHIARQCPDNPKGLYPNGGCCKLCGDVTHLKKDCPTVKDKKEGSSIKLQTLNNAENIEDVDQPIKVKLINEDFVKKPKKIKF